MRVTFVLPTADLSGGIRVISIYAKKLQERGHKVVLVFPPPAKVPLRRKIKSLLKGNGWLRTRGKGKSHLDGIGLDCRILREHRPVVNEDVPDADVVIATWWETAEWVNKLTDEKGAKVYFIQHYEVFDYLPVKRCMATYDMPFHKVVIAQWLYEVMTSNFSSASIDIVPNAVDHDQFFSPIRSRQSSPAVGFLYSPIHFKGVDITLKAIEILAARYPDLVIHSFGSRAPEPSIFGNLPVRFRLSPAQDEIREIYGSCDVWLTASRSEGFNLPAMEAMACRTPVVSTKTGWPEEAVVDGRNGYLVEVDDVLGLANAADRILKLPGVEWEEMSKNAYATVAGCTWDASTDLFEASLVSAYTNSRE